MFSQALARDYTVLTQIIVAFGVFMELVENKKKTYIHINTYCTGSLHLFINQTVEQIVFFESSSKDG